MEQLAIPLGNQKAVAKWLVIRRRPESSVCINMPLVFVLTAQVFLIDWIPAFAGMTRKEI